MKALLKSLLGLIGILIILVLLGVGGFLLFSTINEFKPKPEEPAEVTGTPLATIDSTTSFSLITWNIGYGGLGKEMDFFYDGGTRVRPEKLYFEESISGIGNFLNEHDTVEFILLQEVDRDAKRSYYLDEVEWLQTMLPGFCFAFAANYDCRFVPVPVSEPMGKVTSGLVSCSRFLPDNATRYGFDKHVDWPKRLFYLKRCFLVSRFSLADSHQLVLINIHNSAFDTGGALRTREMEMLQKFMTHEYEAGNYLVAGGDWNANPPGFEPEEIATGDVVKQDEFTEMKSFFPDWEFVFDPQQPTNRDVDSAYQLGITPVTTIDFFLLSPNIKLLNIQTFATGFTNSDHQPVFVKIALSPAL